MYMSLPTEILELVVDSLDKESVRNLSLVCRTLHPHCRKRLFHTISGSARALWEFLSGTPELCPYICTIRYICDNDPPTNISATVVSQQLTQLRSLHITRIFGADIIRWTTTPHRHALLSLLHLPTLTHLQLKIDNFFLPDLIPCTGLKHLEFCSVKFEDGPADLPVNLPKPIIIDQLSMGWLAPGSLQVLSNAKRADGKPIVDLTAFKTLYTEFQLDEDRQEITEFVAKAQHLIEVEMDLSFSNPPWDLYSMVMGSLETLKLLKFVIDAFPSRTSPCPIMGLSLELERLKKRNVVENVEILIAVYNTHDLNRAAQWVLLDETLSKEGWSSLNYVSLGIQVMATERHDNDNKLVEAFLKMQEVQVQFARLALSSTIRFEFEVHRQGRVHSLHTQLEGGGIRRGLKYLT